MKSLIFYNEKQNFINMQIGSLNKKLLDPKPARPLSFRKSTIKLQN